MREKEHRRRPIERHADPYRVKKSGFAEADDDILRPGAIVGRNAVIEALRAGRPLDKVYIAKGDTDSARAHRRARPRGGRCRRAL